MRVLIAEDDLSSRRLLESLLARWGYEVVVTVDGDEAWRVLQQEGAPPLMVLDWSMPGMDGLELCQRVREAYDAQRYIILLSARGGKDDVVEGLRAGVDDYVTKPFDPEELQARIQVGFRVMSLQSALTGRLKELEDALSRIKRLQGLLPICASCNRIRDDKGYWNRVEYYIREHSEAEFTHSICPACVMKLYPDQYSTVFPDESIETSKECGGMTHDIDAAQQEIVITVDPDLEDLIPGFLDNRYEDIDALMGALDRKDYETIRRLGHIMKGAGGGYGFCKTPGSMYH